MSKAAIATMTRSLAVEWGRYGIRLNAIAPGVFPTEGAAKRLRPGEEPGARTKTVNPMGRVGRNVGIAEPRDIPARARLRVAQRRDHHSRRRASISSPPAASTICANGATSNGASRASAIRATNEKDRAARGP